MVGSLACRGVAVDIALNAVVAYALNGERAALHKEILVARDAILDCCCDVDACVPHLHIFSALDGVGILTIDGEHSPTLQFEMAFAIERRLLCQGTGRVGAVGEGVGGFCLDTEIDTLAIHNANGCSGIDRSGIGKGEATQFHGGFVGAAHVELAIAALAREGVGDFLVHIVALRYADMCSVDGRRHQMCDIACHINLCRRAFVNNADGGGINIGGIDKHTGNVADGEGLVLDGERTALGISHRARIGSRKLIDDVAHDNV